MFTARARLSGQYMNTYSIATEINVRALSRRTMKPRVHLHG